MGLGDNHCVILAGADGNTKVPAFTFGPQEEEKEEEIVREAKQETPVVKEAPV